MQEFDDNALLRNYVENDSEEAFAALVTRHINKVYSVALRHTGNGHEAEEITQAVFVILARKSRHLGKRVILSGWLYQTARLAALTFIRSAIRRTRREQEAFMQNESNGNDAEVWKQIAPLLDTAMAGLNETDRHAVVLRFFDGKSMSEIGTALGATEDAAKKRVGRALEKLQRYFSQRGIASTTDTIAGAMATHSVQAAPALLIQTTTAAALAKGSAAGSSILSLVKATLIAMNTKAIIATVATAVILAGITTWLAGSHFFHKSPPAPTGIPSETIPILFGNDWFAGKTNAQFAFDLDPNTRRTTNSAPAGHIKSVAKMDVVNSSVWYIFPGTNASFIALSHVYYRIDTNSILLGKRIRVSGWIKSKDVENWAGGVLQVWSHEHSYGYDDSTSRPVTGTSDWQQIEFVADVPKEPCFVGFAVALYGNGEIWFDDFRLEIVSPVTPVTSDQNHMRFFGARPDDYSETTDYQVKHDGHPTLCIGYLPQGTPPPGARMYWGKEINYPDTKKYLGHTVRMTVWTKSENMTGSATASFHPRDISGKIIAREQGNKSIKGTTDWTEHTFTCRIPEETDFINNGFNITGGGKLWIDVDSIKYEIVK